MCGGFLQWIVSHWLQQPVNIGQTDGPAELGGLMIDEDCLRARNAKRLLCRWGFGKGLSRDAGSTYSLGVSRGEH